MAEIEGEFDRRGPPAARLHGQRDRLRPGDARLDRSVRRRCEALSQERLRMVSPRNLAGRSAARPSSRPLPGDPRPLARRRDVAGLPGRRARACRRGAGADPRGMGQALQLAESREGDRVGRAGRACSAPALRLDAAAAARVAKFGRALRRRRPVRRRKPESAAPAAARPDLREARPPAGRGRPVARGAALRPAEAGECGAARRLVEAPAPRGTRARSSGGSATPGPSPPTRSSFSAPLPGASRPRAASPCPAGSARARPAGARGSPGADVLKWSGFAAGPERREAPRRRWKSSS